MFHHPQHRPSSHLAVSTGGPSPPARRAWALQSQTLLQLELEFRQDLKKNANMISRVQEIIRSLELLSELLWYCKGHPPCVVKGDEAHMFTSHDVMISWGIVAGLITLIHAASVSRWMTCDIWQVSLPAIATRMKGNMHLKNSSHKEPKKGKLPVSC